MDILWFCFSLSLLIVTIIFMEVYIHDHESLLPDFNYTMFQFILVGHWIALVATIVMLIIRILHGYDLLKSVHYVNHTHGTLLPDVKL